MVQSNDPYNNQPQQQPTHPDNPQAGSEAFGFAAQDAPKDEKYNTRYLVQNMSREGRNQKFFIGGAVLAALLALAAYMITTPGPEPVEPASLQQGADAKAAAQAKEAANEDKADSEPAETVEDANH